MNMNEKFDGTKGKGKHHRPRFEIKIITQHYYQHTEEVEKHTDSSDVRTSVRYWWKEEENKYHNLEVEEGEN